MAHKKQASSRMRRKEAVPVVGMVGVSLSLAGGASAATVVPTADLPLRDTTAPPQITLREEEIADVSLGTFYVFDKETAGTPRLGQQLARGCGGGVSLPEAAAPSTSKTSSRSAACTRAASDSALSACSTGTRTCAITAPIS